MDTYFEYTVKATNTKMLMKKAEIYYIACSHEGLSSVFIQSHDRKKIIEIEILESIESVKQGLGGSFFEFTAKATNSIMLMKPNDVFYIDCTNSGQCSVNIQSHDRKKIMGMEAAESYELLKQRLQDTLKCT